MSHPGGVMARFRNLVIFAVSTAIFFILPLRSGISGTAGQPIRIGGTGGPLAVMRQLADEFQRTHPNCSIRIFSSMGSNGGIKAVLAGDLDIGVSARPLDGKEHGAVAHEYARTPLVFAVKKNNRATGFSLPELVALYSGASRLWPDNKQIRLVLRPAAEYDTSLLKSMSPEMDRAVTDALSRQGMIIAVTDQDSADSIERVPGALGTITLGQLLSEKAPLKALSLNKVKPGLNTLADGTYPYFKTYYLVTRPEQRHEVREFVDFLHSAPAAAILTRSGYQTR